MEEENLEIKTIDGGKTFNFFFFEKNKHQFITNRKILSEKISYQYFFIDYLLHIN